MSEIELKPCPFCGGEAEIHGIGSMCNVIKLKKYRVECKKCGCSSNWTEASQDATDLWNKRTGTEKSRAD